MNVVYALNRNLYKWLPMSMNSLFAHNPNCKVYVICEDDDIPTIKDSRVVFLNINNYPHFDVHPLYQYYVLSDFTFVRIWMERIIPESRIIWLDVDTIIDGPLDELWNLDLRGKIIGGVFDAYPSYSEVTGLYINAGVLLIDLDKWRANHLTETLQNLLKNKYFALADQDAINYICKPYIKYIDLKWNYQLSQPAQVKVKDPVIYHYAAHPKLWESVHVQHWNKYYVGELKNEYL